MQMKTGASVTCRVLRKVRENWVVGAERSPTETPAIRVWHSPGSCAALPVHSAVRNDVSGIIG
jgi:hypothetical protein